MASPVLLPRDDAMLVDVSFSLVAPEREAE
jgi:hypothetical protein